MWLLVSPLSVSIFISKPGCQLAGPHSLVLSQRLIGGWPTLCQQGFYFLQMDLCGMESALKRQAIFRSTEPFQVFLHLFHTCAQASSSRDAWEAWATRISAAHVRSLWSVWGRLIRDLTDHLWLSHLREFPAKSLVWVPFCCSLQRDFRPPAGGTTCFPCSLAPRALL